MNRQRLFDILSLKRGHGSQGEIEFIEKFILPYDPTSFVEPDTKMVLGYAVSVGESDTLFTAHTDTVHGRVSKYKIAVDYEEATTAVHNWYGIEGDKICALNDPLGADDGAGVWLLLEMIDAGVPGTYLFPRGEECGGIGSTGIAKWFYPWLKGFKRAIAFDRKGTHSVITFQSGTRCCSETFAQALSDALATDEYFFAPDDGGVFTDTANFTDDIAECTNVSIGYMYEHTSNEVLDTKYLFALRDKCLEVKWDELPTERVPGTVEYSKSWGSHVDWSWYEAGSYSRKGDKRKSKRSYYDTVPMALADDYDADVGIDIDDLPLTEVIAMLRGMKFLELCGAVHDLNRDTLEDVVIELLNL